jgi:hypothetical protein
MGKSDRGADGPDRSQAGPQPQAAGTGGQADRLKDMQAKL